MDMFVGTVSVMTPIENKAVGRRLRELAKDLGLVPTRVMADYLGAQRGAVDAWFNGRALPPAGMLAKLKDEHGVTLDWIFFGDPSALPYALGIRLQALSIGEDVPPVAPGVLPVRLVENEEREAAGRPLRKSGSKAT